MTTLTLVLDSDKRPAYILEKGAWGKAYIPMLALSSGMRPAKKVRCKTAGKAIEYAQRTRELNRKRNLVSLGLAE